MKKGRKVRPMDATPIVRCAVYARTSSDERLRSDFNSLDAQQAACQSYAESQKSRGWTLISTDYQDGGFSGKDTDRPALQRLLTDVHAGKIDAIIAYKLDRISRSLRDFLTLMETFEKHGVAVVSVTQAIDTSSSMGRLLMNVLMSFAEFEREQIAERISDKIAASRRRGRWTGGTPILGYDVDRSGASPKLVVNANEAARVISIFNLYAESSGLIETVRELNRLGWACKSWTTRDGRIRGGEPFNKSTLSHHLSNPLYIGKIRHKDRVFDGLQEAIVPAALFDRVQAQLRRNSQPAMRVATGALLSGLLRCKACGRAMSHSFTCHGKVRHRYYRCSTALKRGRSACSTPSLAANEIERAVIDEIRVIGRDRVLIRATARAAKQQVDLAISRLQRERQLLGRADGDAGAGDRIATIDHELVQLRGLDLSDKAIAGALQDFDRLWEGLTPRERHEIIHQLVERVEFDAANTAISITFKPSGLQTLAARATANSESAA